MTNLEEKQSLTQAFSVGGMTCQGCVQQVKTDLQNDSGISEAVVTLDPPMAIVTFIKDAMPIERLETLLSAKYSLDIPTEVNAIEAEESPDGAQSNFVQIGGDSKTVGLKRGRVEKAASLSSKSLVTYWPLILVVGYILGGTIISMAVSTNWSMSFGMRIFMGLFFVAFSFFKLLDLNGFANAYRSYDWIAKKIPQYGFVYPLIELGLGIGYLIGFSPLLVNWVTLVVMVVSIVGVIDAVIRRATIRCACLGTGFNLPMSTVTIIEDGAMILMAAIMILKLS